jgi:ketosteroid isomerase-like protein
MSQKNVEIVRAAIEAVLRRPNPDWETINALYHPDHEFLPRDVELEGGGSRRGARGYRDWRTSAAEAIEWEGTLAEVTEIDDERVLAVAPTKFRGRQSGVEIELRHASIITVREGKVVRTEIHASPEQALESAGLRE